MRGRLPLLRGRPEGERPLRFRRHWYCADMRCAATVYREGGYCGEHRPGRCACCTRGLFVNAHVCPRLAFDVNAVVGR